MSPRLIADVTHRLDLICPDAPTLIPGDFDNELELTSNYENL